MRPLIAFWYACAAASLVLVGGVATAAPQAVDALAAWSEPAATGGSAAAAPDAGAILAEQFLVASRRLPAAAEDLSLVTPELGVWLLVRHTEALRGRDAFALLDSNLDVLQLLPTPVAPVPLPLPAWLLAVGVAGLWMTRRRSMPESHVAAAS